MLTGISEKYLNMLANAVKMQIHEYFGILCILWIFCLHVFGIFLEFLTICWYFQHPVQIDMRMLLVFLAQCPHTEICKMEFVWIFFHSHKYLQYFETICPHTRGISTNGKYISRVFSPWSLWLLQQKILDGLYMNCLDVVRLSTWQLSEDTHPQISSGNATWQTKTSAKKKIWWKRLTINILNRRKGSSSTPNQKRTRTWLCPIIEDNDKSGGAHWMQQL